MENKNWQETAADINDCLKYMSNSQFRNSIGFIDGYPVCAIMFGVEFCGQLLRIYNLVVNPEVRDIGIGSQAVRDVFTSENKFNLNKTFNKVIGAVYPENKASIKMLERMGFKRQKREDGLTDFEKDLEKDLEK